MIPETAIQAAAKALASDSTAGLIGRDDPNLEWKTWAGNARSALEAALPHIVESFNQLVDQAVFKVDGVHHFHGSHCLCGEPASARARSQTEHITSAVVTELVARIAEEGTTK